MDTIGFWESLFGDVGHTERQYINQAAMELNALEADNHSLRSQIRKLYNLDKAQSAELAKLRTMVRVLMEYLVDSSTLDRTRLEERLESGFEELERKNAPEQVGPGGPYRGSAAEATEPEPTGTCTLCKNERLLRRTTMTPEGLVCDPCTAFGRVP